MRIHPNALTRWFALTLATALTAAAQTAPALSPSPQTTAPSADAVVELSPFTVNTTQDLGYLAENTLAGSRLNARLRDTAGSVSVFTREFLDDLAITDIAQLLDYTVNSEMDTNAWQAGSGQNPAITGENLLNRTLIRGLAASQGIDYFNSITNPDPYRVARFDDTRGPNSILFGIGAPGGLLNQSSKVAVTHGHSANLRYGFGSWERSRAELDVNRVLIKDKLAISVAALHQENGGWRQFDFQDKERIFGAITVRPLRTLTLQAMGETGRDTSAVMKTMPPGEAVLAWYDNRAARGVSAVTIAPTTAAPNAALIALGITTRNGTRGGQNRRAVFIENNGTIFDAIGTYLTGSYNNAAVRGPDGTPGVTGSALVINDPELYPRWANAGGPGMRRTQDLYNFTLTADWQPTKNLVFNFGHHYQQTTLTSRILVGVDPVLRGDPNRTLGISGPANPFAGQLYFDGNWRGDIHYGDYRESRVSASYAFNPKNRWWGRHRVASSWSHSDQSDLHALSFLSLVGSPYNAVANSPNNRVISRNYVTEGDYSTYRVGDWRTLPAKFTFDGRTFDTAFVNDVAGANNSGMKQGMDSLLAVVQSYFFSDKLVTTLGYREDQVTINQLGYYIDPVIGDVIDADPAKATVTKLKARTETIGAVYHVTNWFSLIANRSSNLGVPPLARTVFPLGNLAPLSRGKGEDYGIGLDLLDGRVSARLVYFTANEQGRITSAGLGGAPARNARVMNAYGPVLAGAGLPFTTAQWADLYKTYNPPANAIASDFYSEGYEARITTNLTRNWRLVANYSYTDSGRSNLATEMIEWYGLKAADGVKLVQGVTQDASGRYIIDPSAYESGGTIAKWIELGGLRPNANPSDLESNTNGVTVAQEIFTLVDTLNDEKEQQEKRWGVRPHKISFFTAYDFKEGRLKGFTVGGGWRWRSANIIGSKSSGKEIRGEVITAADMMMAYGMKLKRLPGRVRFQVNVSNLFDQTDIIPVRLSTSATASDGFVLPGNRGVAYSRYDLVAPREIRFTTTYSF
jgi:outer membrane receptor for ferric coprogen and ferric-rhodotorulic acid